MLDNKSTSRDWILLSLILIPLFLSIGSFIFVNGAIILYNQEKHNENIYLNTTCEINGTISFNEQCKDDICWWPISTGLCPTTFRLCLKTIYVINYANNQKAFTDKRPLWADDEDNDSSTTCYYDKTKSGILRWDKPKTKQLQIEILFGSFIFILSIILWIVWFYLKNDSNNNYSRLQSEW